MATNDVSGTKPRDPLLVRMMRTFRRSIEALRGDDEESKLRRHTRAEEAKKAAAKKENPVSDPTRDRALRAISTIMGLGLLGILLTSTLLSAMGAYFNFYALVGNIGLGLIMALAAALVGGIMGFLFGVPRSRQQDLPVSTPSTNVSTNDQSGAVQPIAPLSAYGNNTNLEQISDWLTKILVGVGLTQINALQDRFDSMVYRLARGFVTDEEKTRLLFPYTAVIVVFFAIGGFLMVYLWARIYLLNQLNAEAQILNLKQQVEKTKTVLAETTTQLVESSAKLDESQTMAHKTRISQLEYKIQQFGKQVNAVVNAEKKFEELIARAAPAPITVLHDSQKDRWGGEFERDGLRLVATFTPHPTMAGIYTVDLAVESTGANVEELTTPVYFFLHESYNEGAVDEVQPQRGKASCTPVESYEAFTVGAVCRDGAVKLELDLNLHQDCPSDYRYTCKVERIDDLRKELENLRADPQWRKPTQGATVKGEQSL